LQVSSAYQVNSFEVFSMDGKRLIVDRKNQNKLDVSQLTSGTYLVLVKCDEGQVLLQMQKQ